MSILPRLLACITLAFAAEGAAAQGLAELNAGMFREMQQRRGVSASELARVKEIFARSAIIGQGNPAITRHALTPEECAARLPGGIGYYDNPRFEQICGDKYMAPLYDPRTQSASQATACIDQFEYPNVPCTYPVVWVKTSEAAQICAAEGKRLCDAHEWEGACAGALEAPDYRFDLAEGVSPSAAVSRMQAAHNAKYEPQRAWAYGANYQAGVCAAASFKNGSCDGGSFNGCGSNTYPTGSFPGCTSPLKVYDLHGNAAEHMNLPLSPGQMSSRGSTTLGVTEMKGSWFIWDTVRAHPDWCRWRAPFWHGSSVMSSGSHANYHLGFRCCKSI
ncbi:MAG: hypothetical protein Q8J98_02555 [Phaeovulum sp.]|uniref:SUMF1/EgtB/PvdO family nonheme iron enzyme n=1 Tax=Phaeovulum sp. TaxID=2934796 RepID=UPI00272FAFDE|nr:SUMF1/EgtB/PvdO family nonheme iron enzyme [Phaeovulum sp.]MDP2061971.1 hypothetical protein [Phaeovulum sp.]